MKKEFFDILNEIKRLENSPEERRASALPSNTYFLGEDKILCYPRAYGFSRYPYHFGGRVMWVYSTGMVKVEESTFNIILPAWEGNEPNLALYSGVKKGDAYEPFSLLAFDGEDGACARYVVYAPNAAYFFTLFGGLTYAVKLFMDSEKQICLTVRAFNEGGEDEEILLSSYFDLFMYTAPSDNFEIKWYKRSTVTPDYGLLESLEYFGGADRPHHYGLIRRGLFGCENARVSQTASRIDYTGGYSVGVRSAACRKTGKFPEEKRVCAFTEKSIYGDLICVNLPAGESVGADYVITVCDDKSGIENLKTQPVRGGYVCDQYEKLLLERAKTSIDDRIQMRFGEMETLSARVMNNFLKNVVRQVDFCAKAKNYAGRYLGVRDIFQQVEACLVWDSEYCREKIKQCISFIGDDGRAPRQFAFPAFENALPQMDLRKFIDQGVWIISTLYSYLTFTGDFSILEEECGYYELGAKSVDYSTERDSILCHLIRIADYLIRNIDPDTGCLCALYGDWNDAIDGLGSTKKAGKEFGNGVSVMASLQLYQCLNEMVAIFDKLGAYPEKKAEYAAQIERLKAGLQMHAVVDGPQGRKILHGWGEDKSFLVGSYCDSDGASRDSATSSAFWVLCGGYGWDESIKADILSVYDRLDSKYGITTFAPGFTEEDIDVGRIGCLPIGTAENSATYIHATLFAIWSLFKMGEGKRAWEQLLKVLPVTHKEISTSPFIMSNSYVRNEELGMDGESMNDWFTGSGCVLLKVMVRCVFGVQPTLEGIELRPSDYFPTDRASLKLTVQGKELDIRYRNEKRGARKILVNGRENLSPLKDKTTKTLLIEIID